MWYASGMKPAFVFATLLLSTLSLTACDEAATDEVGPRAVEVWQPCKESCDGGVCVRDEDAGSICIAGCNYPTCNPLPAVPADMCGDPIGTAVCNTASLCVLVCDSPDDCGAGMVCSALLGMCVWP